MSLGLVPDAGFPGVHRAAVTVTSAEGPALALARFVVQLPKESFARRGRHNGLWGGR